MPGQDGSWPYSSFPGMTEMAADLDAKPFTPEQAEKQLECKQHSTEFTRNQTSSSL